MSYTYSIYDSKLPVTVPITSYESLTKYYQKDSIVIEKLDESRIIVVYSTFEEPSINRAVVFTKLGNNTFEPGADISIGTGTMRQICMTVLDPNKVIIAYQDLSNLSRGTARLLIAVNDVITVGSPVVFETGSTSAIDIAMLDTNRAIVVYSNDSASLGTACLLTVSAETINVGANTVISGSVISGNSDTFHIDSLSSDKVIITYKNSSSPNELKSKVLSIIDNVITAGTEYTVEPEIAYDHDIVSIDSTKAIAVYVYASNVVARVLNIDNSGGITANEKSTIFNSSGIYANQITASKNLLNQIFVSMVTSDQIQYQYEFTQGVLFTSVNNSNIITVENTAYINYSETAPISSKFFNDNTALVLYCDDILDNRLKVKAINPNTVVTVNKFINSQITNQTKIYNRDRVVTSTNKVMFGKTSAYFDGSSSLMLDYSGSSFSINGNFTLEAFVNANILSDINIFSNTKKYIFRKNGGSNNVLSDYTKGYALGVAWNGFPTFFAQVGDGVDNIIFSNLPIATNIWYHVALVIDGTELKLFVSGVLRASKTINTPQDLDIGYAWIGTDPAATNRFWEGHIDEIRITGGVARYTDNFTVPTATFEEFAPFILYATTTASSAGTSIASAVSPPPEIMTGTIQTSSTASAQIIAIDQFNTKESIVVVDTVNSDYTSIAGLSTGDFVVSYQQVNEQSVNPKFARFDSLDVLQGSITTVEAVIPNYNKIAGLNNGDFVIAYVDTASSYPKFARYNSSGVLQGSITTVQSTVSALTSVAGLSNGDFVVAYRGNGISGHPRFARYNSSGVLQGSITTIESVGAYNTSVAGLSNGDFVVAYRNSSTSYPKFARYNSSGVLQGSITTIETVSSADTSVAGLSNGDFVVAYRGINGYPTFARYNSSGVLQGSITTIESVSAFNTSVAGLSNGDFVVAYRGINGYPTFARYDSLGLIQGGINYIDTVNAFNTSVSKLSNGDFVVAYEGINGYPTFARYSISS